jgi:hypothetical protein
MTPQEYATILVARFNSMREAEGDQRLLQIFLGAKDSVADYPEDVRQAYDLAEKELFPYTPVTPSELIPNGDQSKPEPEQTPIKPTRPTTADLYNAWKSGGKSKLMETLPDEPDPDDE